MATSTVYEPIRGFIEANLAAHPLVFDNEGDAPNDQVLWIYVDVVGDTISQQTIGTGSSADERYDEEGAVLFSIMVPEGSGTTLARRVARTIVDLFRSTTLLNGNLEFLDASVGRSPARSDDGKWFGFSVEIYWRHLDA